MQGQVDNLRRRILTVCYVLCLLALAYVILRIVAYIEAAVLLLAAAILLAYLIKPLVTFFHRPITLKLPRRLYFSREAWREPSHYTQVRVLRKGLPWMASILTVYAILICIIVLVVSFVVPLVVHEFKNFLAQGLPTLEAQIRANLEASKAWLIAHLPPEAADTVPLYVAQAGSQLSNWAFNSMHALPPLMGQLLGMAVIIFLVPLLTFYLLLDMEHLRQSIMRLFPATRRTDARELFDKIDDVLGHYIRGQLAVACIIGCTISIVLNLLGLPYAVIIGIFAGFINLIPYVGTPLGMIPAFLVAFFMPVHGGLVKGLVVLLAMYLVYITEGKVIVPTVVGKSVGLPPIVIIFSLIVGAELLGIAGMLLAVPSAAIIRVIVDHYIEKRDRNENVAPLHVLSTREVTALPKEVQQY